MTLPTMSCVQCTWHVNCTYKRCTWHNPRMYDTRKVIIVYRTLCMYCGHFIIFHDHRWLCMQYVQYLNVITNMRCAVVWYVVELIYSTYYSICYYIIIAYAICMIHDFNRPECNTMYSHDTDIMWYYNKYSQIW